MEGRVAKGRQSQPPRPGARTRLGEGSPNDRVASYETAVSLANHQGDYVWSSFAALAQSHSIFIGLAGVFLAAGVGLGPNTLRLLSALVAALGIVLCFLWMLILVRQFDFYRYWFAYARHLEEEAYGETMLLLRAGGAYSDGRPVQVPNSPKAIRMSKLGNIARVRHLAFATVWVFLAIYAVILAVAVML